MKKFMILMLSLAVLFSFAACDNSGSNANTSMIGGATVTGGGEKVYIPGETVDLSDYTFSITMLDNTVQPANASDFVFDSLVVDGANFAPTGTYKGIASAEVTLDVNVGTVTEIEINDDADTIKREYFAPKTTKNEYRDGSIDLTGIVVTATYTDENNVQGTKTVALDNKYLKKEMTATSDASGGVGKPWELESATVGSTNDNIVTVFFDITDTQTAANATIKDTYDVEVIENLVKSVALKADASYKVWLNSETSLATTLAYATITDDKAGKDGVYVEATYESGEVVALEDDDITFGTLATNATQAITAVSPETEGSHTIFASYNGTDMVVGAKNVVSCSVNAQNNVVEGIEATYDDTALDFLDYSTTANLATLQGYLNVVPTYSNKAKGTALAATDYTVTGPNNSLDFRTGYRLGERIELTVTAKENSAWTDTVVAQFKTI